MKALTRTSRLLAPRANLSAPWQTTSRGYLAPLRDIKFCLNEVHDIQEHYSKLEYQTAADPDTMEMVLGGMAKFSEDVLAPLNEVGDTEGCTHISEKEVKTPTGFKEAYFQFIEDGWQGISYPEELDGQGLPQSLNLFISEMVATANWTWAMFPGLSKGCINTLFSHGSDELKDKYLKPLVAGTWTGTMCLTEPQGGSDLGQVSTKAIPQEDGTYKITGTKIFISCGDHDFTDNIMHCVLARLPDAPEGTRGISLFLVPKYLVDSEGNTTTTFNSSNIGRLEDKMGCHGSPTCEINFDNAEGYLIGTPNKGLNHMFTFINTSRMGTALQGVAGAENAYQEALWYAKDRLAMRSLTGVKEPTKPADPIIVHPAVRMMLLTQKAISEGGRSMLYECAKIGDLMYECERAGDKAGFKHHDEQMAFLTPILKGFLSEVGVEAANLGIQVYGGHGYIKSNKQEQFLRDVRISAVWEGTTQIQALDLLGRKIMLQKLKPINEHCAMLRSKCMSLITGNSALRSNATTLLWHALEWQYLTYRIGMKAKSDKDVIGVASVDYLMYSGYVQLAYHWLLMEEAAVKALADPSRVEEAGFYEAKIQTSNFVFSNILPRTASLKASMMTPVDNIMGMKPEQFSYDHSL